MGCVHGGEVGLPDWHFTVSTDLDGFIGTATTDSSGHASVVLPAGAYVVTESIPASPGLLVPDWAATTPAGSPSTSQAFAVTVGGGNQDLLFGNGCLCPEDTDSNLCTVRTCVASGLSANPVVCSDETAIDCDGDACTPQSCDPAVGCTGTSSGQSPCDPVTYYLPVRNSDTGAMTAIKCSIEPGEAPTCQLDANGALALFDGEGGACTAPTDPGPRDRHE